MVKQPTYSVLEESRIVSLNESRNHGYNVMWRAAVSRPKEGCVGNIPFVSVSREQ